MDNQERNDWLVNSRIQGEKLNGIFIRGGMMEIENHFG